MRRKTLSQSHRGMRGWTNTYSTSFGRRRGRGQYVLLQFLVAHLKFWHLAFPLSESRYNFVLLRVDAVLAYTYILPPSP